MNIGDELGQDDAPPGDAGAIEKQGVDQAAGDGGEHIAGEVGIAAGGEKEAEGVLCCTEENHHHRAADQGAKGSGQEGDADGEALPYPDGAVAEDDTGGDHQGGKNQGAVVFHLLGGGAPVGGGKWGLKNGHKNTSSVFIGSPEFCRNSRTEEQGGTGAAGQGTMRQRDAENALQTAGRHFVRRTTPRPGGTGHTFSYSA